MTATRHGRATSAPAPVRVGGLRRVLAVPALAVLTVLGALAVVASRAPVLVHQCVAGDGLAGALGLRLALLRADGTCPSGTLAVGGEGAHAAGVVILVAAPVLALHLALAGAGAGLVAAAAVLVRTLGRALRRIVPALPTAAVLPVAPRTLRPVGAPAPVLASWMLPTVGLRGPPLATA